MVSGDVQYTILAVVTTGVVAGSGPILEICRILHSRGYIIEFATLAGQENVVSPYPFISCSHIVGRPITSKEAKHCSRIWSGQDRSNFRSLQNLADSMKIQKARWAEASQNLRQLAMVRKPAFLLVDWQVEPAVDFLAEQHIPCAVMWPHTAWTRGQMPDGEPGFLVTLRRRINEVLDFILHVPAPRISADFIRWREEICDDLGTRQKTMPRYFSLTNSFFGAEPLQTSSPMVIPVGPILEDTIPPLSQELEAFLNGHERVLYISLGTHATFPRLDIQQIMQGIMSALEQEHIDGVIWATQSLARKKFFDVFEQLLDNRDPHWRFLCSAPRRAVLCHPSTRLFLSQCGTLSLNDAAYHGVPMLAIDRDHPLNSKQAELIGIADSISYKEIDSIELCKKIAIAVQDVYGSVQRAVLYMQKLAAARANRKELAADVVEKAILDHKHYSMTLTSQDGRISEESPTGI